jgi:hypothetical protein
MTAASSNDNLLQQIDDLLEQDDLSTKIGLRFAFTVLRDAMTVIMDMKDRVSAAENGYVSMTKNMSTLSTDVDDVKKKVNVMWIGYQIGVWVATIFGVSMITLIWSLLTGAATLTFGKP